MHEWVLQNNYTLNVRGVQTAIKHLYTYWPDQHNKTWIRHMYINVSTGRISGLDVSGVGSGRASGLFTHVLQREVSFLSDSVLEWLFCPAPCHEPQAPFTVTSPRLPIPSQPKVY